MSLPSITYGDVQMNYYVRDVELLTAFYCEHLGFRETFRTPKTGKPDHVEVRLGHFVLGFASVEAGRTAHGLPLDPGSPTCELAIWTNDVDRAHNALIHAGIRCIRPPHDFQIPSGTLRAAWFYDPEGNIFEIVCKQKTNQ